MEEFRGILKCDMYYLDHFETLEELLGTVGQFSHCYNYQRLNCPSPMDYGSLLEAKKDNQDLISEILEKTFCVSSVYMTESGLQWGRARFFSNLQT